MPYAAARDGGLLQERVSEGVCQNTTGCRESLGQRQQRQGSPFSAITRDAPRDTGRLVMHVFVSSPAAVLWKEACLN